MYNVSDLFKEEINKLTFVSKITGKIVTKTEFEIPFTSDDISQGSFSINGKCVSNNDFELGSVYAQELRLTIKSEVDRYTLYDAKVFPEFNLRLSDGTWESVPLGVFNITEAIRSGFNISIKGIDNMVILDDDEQMGFTAIDGTAWQLLTVISDVTHVELAQTQADIEALPNGGILVGFDTNDDIRPRTFRDVLSYIATLTGTIAVMDRFGKIELRKYSKEPNVVLNNKKKSGTSISDYSINYQSIKTKAGSDVWVVENEVEGQEYTTHEIPFFENLGETTTKQCLTNILAEISTITFVPASFSYSSGNPAIDLCDMIEVDGTGREAEKKVNMLVMSLDWKFRGQQTVKCLGSNPILARMRTKEEKELTEVISKVGENELVYNNYTNSKKYTIVEGQQPVDIVKIAYLASKETSGEFKSQIHFSSLAGDTVLDPIKEIVTEEGFDMEQDPVTNEWTKTEWTRDVEVITGYNVIGYNSTLKFTYRIDDVEIDTVYPEEVVQGGKHMVWLYYPLERIFPGVVHKFEVFLHIIGEPIVIDKLHINAMIIGQGMASMKFVWDGTLTFEEDFGVIVLSQTHSGQSPPTSQFTSEQSVNFVEHQQFPEFTELMQTINFGSLSPSWSMSISGFISNMTFIEVIEQRTAYAIDIFNTSQNMFTHMSNDDIMLLLDYKYDESEQPIDIGHLNICTISDENKQSTLSYEVVIKHD